MIISGKIIAQKIKDDLKMKVESLVKKPTLAVILVGENPASISYVKGKEKACLEVGFNFILNKMNEDVTETEVIQKIIEFNNNNDIDGILVQLPLPKHINVRKVIDSIVYYKDVDGLNSYNAGRLFIDETKFIPCTPLGIMEIFKDINYDLTGKNVTVIGRSNLVGLPLSRLLTKYDATVTLTHSKTKNLAEITKRSDVVIVAIGDPRFINENYLDNQDVVIDVGINRVDGKICGDVDFEKVKDKVKNITPVPGGVGPLTIASLLKNTYQAFKEKIND